MSRTPQLAGSSRWLVIVGLIGLVVSLVALAGTLAWVHASMRTWGYGFDASTGFLYEWPFEQDRWLAVALPYKVKLNSLGWLSGAALIFVALILIGAWRADRGKTRVRLPLLAATLLYPLVLGLGAGLLTIPPGTQLLVAIDAAVSDRVPSYTGWEQPILEPCSHVRAVGTAWLITVLLAGLVVVLFVPAARAAWRAGQRGIQLGAGGRWIAVALFVLGAVALVATQPHRRDHQRTRIACGETGHWTPPPDQHPNLAAPEIEAVAVEDCPAPQWSQDEEPRSGGPVLVVGGYQMFVDGALAPLPDRIYAPENDYLRPLRDPLSIEADEFTRLLATQIQAGLDRAEAQVHEPPTTFSILLYADQRTSTRAVTRQLALARAAGVSEVLVLGEAVVSGQLESVYSWQRRVYCPLARVAADTPELADFEDWGAFVRAHRNL